MTLWETFVFPLDVIAWGFLRMMPLLTVLAIVSGLKKRKSLMKEPFGRTREAAGNLALMNFACYAVSGVLMFLFMSGVNHEMTNGRSQLRLIPAGLVRSAGRVDRALMHRNLKLKIVPWHRPAVKRVQEVIRRLSLSPFARARSDVPNMKINTVVMESNKLDTFISAAGDVIITRGALRLCNNDARLAGILGHEMAHLFLGHIQEKVSISLILRLALLPAHLSAWTLAPSEGTAFLVSSFLEAASNYFITLPHSRRLELEADHASSWYSVGACYDTREYELLLSVLFVRERRSWLHSETIHSLFMPWQTFPRYRQRRDTVRRSKTMEKYDTTICGPKPEQDPRLVPIYAEIDAVEKALLAPDSAVDSLPRLTADDEKRMEKSLHVDLDLEDIPGAA